MAFPLKTEYKAKDPICKISASDLQTICNMLNLLAVEVDENATRASVVSPSQDGKGWKIIIPSSSNSNMPFSGNVWIGGKKVNVPTRTTNYLKITFGTTPSASWVAAMPETMDSDSEVFDINQTAGDLHLPASMG